MPTDDPNVRYYTEVGNDNRSVGLAAISRKSALDYCWDFYGVWADEGRLLSRRFYRPADFPFGRFQIPEFAELTNKPVCCDGTYRIVSYTQRKEEILPKEEIYGG
jgi:hypothetical protein